LRQIDWNAPASLLEKLIEYEAVHRVQSWDDLHHRLGKNRRCFAFIHPSMPGEPLIFVWVALVDEISDEITTVLDISQPEISNEQPTTAVFYSITSTQQGLAGVSLGNYLIKRVVDELKNDLPSLETFATLSPVPGFSTWLKDQSADTLTEAIESEDQKAILSTCDKSFEQLIDNDTWLDDEPLQSAMQEPMQRLLAKYIATEKRKNGSAVNSVAHFHLSNGAIFERINWLADLSERGRSQSYGMMVNYLYDLSVIDENHEQYIEHGVLPQSKNIQKIVR